MTKGKIKMKPSIQRRVDIQISLFTVIVATLLTLSIFWFRYRTTYNDTLIGLRDQAEAMYGCVEKRLDKSTFDQVRTREDMEGNVYKQAHETFQGIRGISGVRYLYTTRMNGDGEFVYLIDCLNQSEPDFRYPGDLIKYKIYSDTQRAPDGQKVLPDRIKGTERGEIFITCIPIYDGKQVLGAVGIEFEAGHQYDTYRSLYLLLPLFILLFSPGTCLASRLLFRCISNPFYRDMLNTDYLTQPRNWSAYQLDMRNHVVGKAQEGIGFILLDLNDPKHVDDTPGHDAGNVYITCASKAYLNMRTKEAVMYHIGGDGFTVMMPGADRDRIQDFIGRFGDTFDRGVSMPESTFFQGRSTYDPKADANLYSTCRRADKDMYTREQQYYRNKNTQEDADGTVGQAA